LTPIDNVEDVSYSVDINRNKYCNDENVYWKMKIFL